MPAIEGPVTGPGTAYIDPLEAGFPRGDQAADSGYVFDEDFASGPAAGEPYRVRVQVARPGEEAADAFSRHAIVEAIHPQGIPFVWTFTRDYLMAHGHAAVSISVFPNTVETLTGADPERYGDLHVETDEANANSSIAFDHASHIYAQVGRWWKSQQTPLPGVKWLYMTGHSRRCSSRTASTTGSQTATNPASSSASPRSRGCHTTPPGCTLFCCRASASRRSPNSAAPTP